MIAGSFRKLSAALPRLAQALAGPRRRTACPVCACRAPVLFDGSRNPEVSICPDCRHLFWGTIPSPKELHAFYAGRYCAEHEQETIQERNRAYYRDHVAELVRLSGRPAGEVTLVDYGSSIPVLVDEARAAGVGSPIAVDVDEKSWAYARARGVRIMTPDQYARLPDGSVDVIRFSHVLEHLIDPSGVVKTAVHKLRPGGLLYVTQPSFPVLQPRRADVPLKDSVYPNHLHFFSPLSLVRLVTSFPVVIHRLFTVDRAEEQFAELSDLIDLAYARAMLTDHEAKGEPGRGARANYPYYAGENSGLYAFKRAA